MASPGSPAPYRVVVTNVGSAPATATVHLTMPDGTSLNLDLSKVTRVGGPQPVTVLSPATFDSLRQFPADGTFIGDAPSGGVWRIAGGARRA